MTTHTRKRLRTPRKRTSILVPVVFISLLSGCSGAYQVSGEQTTCPPPQWPDEFVGEELVEVPEKGFPHFWAWMARVDKLNQQLEKCR